MRYWQSEGSKKKGKSEVCEVGEDAIGVSLLRRGSRDFAVEVNERVKKRGEREREREREKEGERN